MIYRLVANVLYIQREEIFNIVPPPNIAILFSRLVLATNLYPAPYIYTNKIPHPKNSVPKGVKRGKLCFHGVLNIS